MKSECNRNSSVLFNLTKSKYLLTLFIGFLISGQSLPIKAALSCNGVHTCNGPAQELIDKIFPAIDSYGSREVIVTSPYLVSELPCLGRSGSVNAIIEDSIIFEEMYSLLLGAFISNSDIALRIDTAESDCVLLHVRITN